MVSLYEWMTLSVAAIALVIALWSLYVSRRAESRQSTNDFYSRRQQILYRIMESRILYGQAVTLDAEARLLRNRFAALSSDRGQKSNNVPDPNDINPEKLENLEQTVRHMLPKTPVKVLENAAADAEKMYIISKEQVRMLNELLASVKVTANDET